MRQELLFGFSYKGLFCVFFSSSFPPQGLCTGSNPHLTGFLPGSWKAKSFSSLTFQLKCDLPGEAFPIKSNSHSPPHHFVPLPCSIIFLAFFHHQKQSCLCIYSRSFSDSTSTSTTARTSSIFICTISPPVSKMPGT